MAKALTENSLTQPSLRRIEERHDASFSSVFEATRILEERRTEYQDALVFETKQHGRVFLLDGLTMLTEFTHHIYHETMAHVPLSCVQDPKRVLIIGGGDGGTATEVCKWDGVEEIIVAELDQGVVDISKRWFPGVAHGFDDPRVNVRIGDGAAFVAEHRRAFDVVIIDSTDIATADDPDDEDLVASPLATRQFHQDLARALKPEGVGIQIVGSPFFYGANLLSPLVQILSPWDQACFVSMATPFYITGPWVAAMFSQSNPLQPRQFPATLDNLNYLNLDVAKASLAAPNNLRKLMADVVSQGVDVIEEVDE